MKILEIKSLAIPEAKVIKFAKFSDARGYFTETFRKSDFKNHPEMSFMKNVELTQCNESFSRPKTFRGFHFQWNPYMGKLIRPIYGHLIDFGLDIRKGSLTFGKIIAYDMPARTDTEYSEWIWLPPGFAHGVLLLKESIIEYFCSGEYNPECEACVSPLSKDIDWSLCDPNLKKIFDEIVPKTALIADKDKNGFSLEQWKTDSRSDNFVYQV